MAQRHTTTPGATTPRSKALARGAAKALILALVLTAWRWPMATLWSLVALVVAFQVMLWVVPAVVSYRVVRISADPTSDSFDPGSPDVPESVVAAIRLNAPILEGMGFAVGGHYRKLLTKSIYSEVFTTLLLNRTSRQAARIGTIEQQHRGRQASLQTIAFTTEFTDGTLLATSNNPNVDLSRAGFREGSMAFPEISDPVRLYEIHNASVAHFCGDGIRRDLSRIDPDAYQTEVAAREMTKLVDSGQYVLDEERREYRLSLMNVLATTSKERWPTRAVIRAMRARKAARLLRDLGLDRPEYRGFSEGALEAQALS